MTSVSTSIIGEAAAWLQCLLLLLVVLLHGFCVYCQCMASVSTASVFWYFYGVASVSTSCDGDGSLVTYYCLMNSCLFLNKFM